MFALFRRWRLQVLHSQASVFLRHERELIFGKSNSLSGVGRSGWSSCSVMLLHVGEAFFELILDGFESLEAHSELFMLHQTDLVSKQDGLADRPDE